MSIATPTWVRQWPDQRYIGATSGSANSLSYTTVSFPVAGTPTPTRKPTYVERQRARRKARR